MLKRFTRPMLVFIVPLLVAPLLFVGGSSASALPAKTALRGTLNISAASSLTHAFTLIGDKFHKLYPHTTINFNFGSSTTLANQILAGAQVDVFASADLTDMDTVVTASDIRVAPKIFVRNRMEIAVKPGNPLNITGLASLPTAGVVALCAATAPCGIYAANVLKRAGVTIPAGNITRQPNSTSTVLQVSYGDAAAALVYVTDVTGQGKLVQGVKIPINQNTIADYPIARLTDSKNSKLAQAFISYVEGHVGERALASQGFLAP